MKKRILALPVILLFTALLASCSCQHTWQEATCETPKFCTNCEVTEGEALGHSWKEADCTTPKTCSRCGLTEGTPLEHDWLEATCSAPKTCSRCAATDGQPLEHLWEGEATLYDAPFCSVCGTEGQPLPGYLQQNGLVPNALPRRESDYITNTLVRPDLDTTGKFLTSGVLIFKSDATHRIKEGFEWRTVDISITFSESRSALYSPKVSFARADYYQDQELKQAKKQEQFTVAYNGRNYKCQAFYENAGFYYTDTDIVFQVSCYVHVPVGYDGVVLAFHHGSIDVSGMHLHEVEDEHMLLFRMA